MEFLRSSHTGPPAKGEIANDLCRAALTLFELPKQSKTQLKHRAVTKWEETLTSTLITCDADRLRAPNGHWHQAK